MERGGAAFVECEEPEPDRLGERREDGDEEEDEGPAGCGHSRSPIRNVRAAAARRRDRGEGAPPCCPRGSGECSSSGPIDEACLAELPGKEQGGQAAPKDTGHRGGSAQK